MLSFRWKPAPLVVLLALLAPHAAQAAGEPTNPAESAAQKKLKPAYNLEADKRIKAKMSPEELAWEKVLEENLGSFYLPLYKNCKARGDVQAWDYVKDDPKLPRVLIIGDSVSRGYTVPVRHALKGKANVHRAPENCGATARGLQKLAVWLGDGRWDLITFNFSIHDRGAPLADYEKRLTEIARRLKATGAKVLWVSGTPLPKPEEDAKQMVPHNEIAAKVMKAEGIATIDLYAFAKAKQSEYQNPNDVHFKAAGYEALGRKVAEEIAAALPTGTR